MSSWSPMLVTNSPLAYFIPLLSKARKNKKLLPPPLDKNGVFGIFDITYFGLYLHTQSARRRAGRAMQRRELLPFASSGRARHACTQSEPLDTAFVLRAEPASAVRHTRFGCKAYIILIN